jgi:hypothetical protein
MAVHPFLTSLHCQDRASECRRLAQESLSPNLRQGLSRVADMWEALAIEIEFSLSLQAWLDPRPATARLTLDEVPPLKLAPCEIWSDGAGGFVPGVPLG